LSFEGAKIIGEELSGIKNWQKPVGSFLVALNDECTELKLV
jgi:cell division GTPase FtsZ